MDMHLIKLLIFYGSWLVFPWLALLLWRWHRARGRLQKRLASLLIAGSLLFVWARFIEPQWIHVRHTTLEATGMQLDVVLASDLHIGLYKSPGFLQRVVERINALDADIVLIAGDLTYEPDTEEAVLAQLFAPLARLNKPVYAVLGNHDQQMPGPDIDLPLRRVLSGLNVEVIESRTLPLAQGLLLAGLGDHWAGKDTTGHLPEKPAQPLLLLAHNPDSASRLKAGQTALLLAGHTHGGQIRIPWLYRKVIPSQYGFDRGEQYFAKPDGRIRVYTSSGLGEVGLPLRLFNPPVIDVLHLRP